MIKLQNVFKKFVSGKSETFAIKDASLKIEDGDFLAIIGHSGSGKSTLLNLIGGLTTTTKGEVFVNGKNLEKFSDKELSNYRNQEIGFVFQEFHLEPFLTVKENILLPTFFNTSQNKKTENVEKLIQETELTEKENQLVSELSGGQKQRVAIARALINKPKIIIADEPTGNLDSKTGDKIIKLLCRLHKEHKVTLIIATHDESIAKIADRIIKIEDGKIV